MNTFRIIGTIFLLLFCLTTFGQNIECDLFKNAVETDYFKTEFNINKIDSSIIVYDKAKILKGCLNYLVCNKLINITSDSLYRELRPEKYSTIKPPQLIILYDYKKKGNRYTFFFWRPYSGASIKLTYKISKSKLRLINHSIGTF